MPTLIDLTNIPDSPKKAPMSPVKPAAAVGALVGAKQQLQEAIHSVPEARLRKVVTSLSAQDPSFEKALIRELLTSSTKRKASGGKVEAICRWEVCANCEEEFDAGEERLDGECVYHPEDMDADEEQFPDHDEDCHGPMDTPENRKEFPESFIYGCCERNGLSEGCETGVHVAKAHKKRKL